MPKLLVIAAVVCFGLEEASAESVSYAVPNGTYVMAATADVSGNTYVTGATNSANFPASAGAFQTQYRGGPVCPDIFPGGVRSPCYEAFVIKLDSSGALVFATYLGGAGNDVGYAIKADAAGNIYVGGTTSSADFPVTPGAAFRTRTEQYADGFVAKLNSTGSALVYGTYLPRLQLRALAIDRDGKVYATGSGDAGFPTTPGAFQGERVKSANGVIAKLNVDGSSLDYATYLGGAYTYDIAIDAAGNAFITGAAFSDLPVTPGAFQTKPPNTKQSAFVTKLNPAGTGLVYSTYLGGSGLYDVGFIVKLDSQGHAFVAGNATSIDFPVTPGAFQPFFRAPWSPRFPVSFLSRLSATGDALIYSTFVPASALDVDATGNAYVVGSTGSGFPTTPGAYQRCVTATDSNLAVARFTSEGQLAEATYLHETDPFIPGIIATPDGSVYLYGEAFTNQSFVVNSHLRISDPQKQDEPCTSFVLQNAASYAPDFVAPGEIITIRGLNLGPGNAATAHFGPDGRVSTELAGMRVFFDEFPAPLLYVQSQRLDAIIPWEIAGRNSIQAHVEYNGISISAVPVPVAPSAPGFVYPALNSDGTLNSPANPAAVGTVISLFGTGGGLTNPVGITGGLWGTDPVPLVSVPRSVYIGADGPANVDVVYAGSAHGLLSSVFQMNVRIPHQIPLGSTWLFGVSKRGRGASLDQVVRRSLLFHSGMASFMRTAVQPLAPCPQICMIDHNMRSLSARFVAECEI